MILGHDSAIADFLAAWHCGSMHHAWLLGGPRGVGKATFARAAAARLLAEAAGHVSRGSDLYIDHTLPTARFIEGQAHPDFRSHYDDREAGLCDYITAAMKAFAATMRAA